MSALYDRIGREYDATRSADPRIAQRVFSLLNASKGGKSLDAACGTGNYAIALRNMGLMIRGIDQSESMISRARKKTTQIKWHSVLPRLCLFQMRRSRVSRVFWQPITLEMSKRCSGKRYK